MILNTSTDHEPVLSILAWYGVFKIPSFRYGKR